MTLDRFLRKDNYLLNTCCGALWVSLEKAIQLVSTWNHQVLHTIKITLTASDETLLLKVAYTSLLVTGPSSFSVSWGKDGAQKKL
jgi:SET domain-containing protein